MNNSTQRVYEPHIAAFVDLLGFTALIQSGKAELAFEALRAVRLHQEAVNARLKARGLRISMFSDAILISSPVSSASQSAHAVLTYCRILFLEMMNRGIAVRGGVVCDELHHSDPVVFGPAMIQAYRLEQDAIHPRIVVDRKVADIWLHEVIGPSHDGNRFEQQFSEATDGQLHLRIFTGRGDQTPLPPGKHFVRDYFHKPLRTKVENMMANQKLDDRVRRKLTWLLNDIKADEARFGGESKTVYAVGSNLES